MLTANQPDQQTSCWERFKNRPILIGGLTVGGLGAIIVCCVGPAAIGAGTTVGIIIASTVGGCLLGAVMKKCFKHFRSRNSRNVEGEQQTTSLQTKPQDCCTLYSPVNSALLTVQSNYPSHSVQIEQDNIQPQGATFQSLYAQSHQEDLVSLAMTAHKQELPITVQPKTFESGREGTPTPIGVKARG